MKATNNRIQISSVTPFRELMSFDESNADIKSDYDFTKNWSKNHYIEDKKTRGQTTKTVLSSHTLLAHQIEIKKLQNKVEKLQYEKLTLVKWINFLY
jgi:tmRNA-binding protein